MAFVMTPPPLQAYEWPIGDRGAIILHDPSPTQLFKMRDLFESPI